MSSSMSIPLEAKRIPLASSIEDELVLRADRSA